MRRKLIAGNWKMNLDRRRAQDLARAIVAGSTPSESRELVICPPFVYLECVGGLLAGTAVSLGAQNMHSEREGAFTGDVSGPMLADLGCRYVILGHSERRHGLSETSQQVRDKTAAAFVAGLVPIVCVGELLSERDAGQTVAVIYEQCEGSLSGFSERQMAGLAIAYEPVWAIGTGKVASPRQAQEVHSHLRNWLKSRYNPEVASQVRILYGGSVKPDNAADLLSLPDVDGALVGGASLKAVDFLAIALAVNGD
jgi:triosephosphate isomerase